MNHYEPTPLEAVDEPLDISLVEDEIVLVGPGRVAFSMTTRAARETSRRLVEVLDDIAVREAKIAS